MSQRKAEILTGVLRLYQSFGRDLDAETLELKGNVARGVWEEIPTDKIIFCVVECSKNTQSNFPNMNEVLQVWRTNRAKFLELEKTKKHIRLIDSSPKLTTKEIQEMNRKLPWNQGGE